MCWSSPRESSSATPCSQRSCRRSIAAASFSDLLPGMVEGACCDVCAFGGPCIFRMLSVVRGVFTLSEFVDSAFLNSGRLRSSALPEAKHKERRQRRAPHATKL